MNKNKESAENTYEAEVLESTVVDENVLQKVLVRAGRAIRKA